MKENKLETQSVRKLVWATGLPMILSMVLQALYNVVDTAFVINMGAEGTNANLALTYAFPIQILLIAVGVGTGVGINSLLSRDLGEGDKKSAAKVAGNGIFLAVCIYIIFLLFGLFFSRMFITSQANGNEVAIDYGTSYLTIVCTLSFGAIGFNVFERLLQATGKTYLSTIAQVAGAVTNIVLDYVFIYPCGMGVEGAAYATVIGQVVSLLLAMIFHYTLNKEVSGHPKYIKPSFKIIKGIYKIGLPAMIMQALLSVMMFGMNMILGSSAYNPELLQGSFGIYYKIQQLALFACFGLSNALITIVSYNYGSKNEERLEQTVKYGLIDTVIVAAVIVVLFEALAQPIAQLFGMASGTEGEDIVNTCTYAIRIASLGYIFMGVTVTIQGILQGLRKTIAPLILSCLRLVVFVLPIAYLFTLSSSVASIVWWAFPISELLTMVVAIVFLRNDYKKDILALKKPLEASQELVRNN